MSKKIIVLVLGLVCVSSCDMLDTLNESDVFYKYLITVETNLDNLRIDNTYLNSNIMYPYNIYIGYAMGGVGGTVLKVYPTAEYGFILFKLFRGREYDNIPDTIFLDSLTINTPIDTTMVTFSLGNGTDSISVNPKY